MVARRRPARVFDAQRFLNSTSATRTLVTYPRSAVLFAQGDRCTSVLYIHTGLVKLSVRSRMGKDAVVAMLGPGDFLGEDCLTGQPVRITTATAMESTRALVIQKRAMVRLLHKEHALSDRFITNMLAKHIRIEASLVDQLFNSSEKRLARALMLVARYGTNGPPAQVPAHISQDVLAEMIGTTRSRVNFFMNKFRKLGFIEYNGRLKINPSLLTVVLHD